MTQQADFIPTYIKGSSGYLFSIYFPPLPVDSGQKNIIYIPPFAEESNRCRAMMAKQARNLAKKGIGVLAIDLYGTGDSEGNFVDGNWDQWISDVKIAIEWLKEQHSQKCNTLWGVRLGAMLAADVALETEDINKLIFWQPVLNGKNYLTQFLRIRIAANFNNNDKTLGTKELRQQFKDKRSVEVSGYEISPELAFSIDNIETSKITSLGTINIDWFEILTSEKANISRSTQKVIKACSNTGTTISLHQVSGPAFWQLHERILAPDLISETTKQVTES